MNASLRFDIEWQVAAKNHLNFWSHFSHLYRSLFLPFLSCFDKHYSVLRKNRSRVRMRFTHRSHLRLSRRNVLQSIIIAYHSVFPMSFAVRCFQIRHYSGDVKLRHQKFPSSFASRDDEISWNAFKRNLNLLTSWRFEYMLCNWDAMHE